MKKLLIGIGVAAGLLALVVLIAFTATSGLPAAADDFFGLIRDGKIDEAYRATAAEFRASTSEETFAAFLATTAIGDYEDASWSSRSIENRLGKLSGTIGIKGGGRIPLDLTLVKEEGAWKLLSLQKAEAGLTRGTHGAPAVPEQEVLDRLTRETTAALANAINADDFSGFLARAARLWQAQTTADALRQNFAPFIELGIDFTPLSGVQPVFNKDPVIDEDGVLTLEGYYPADPDPVVFRYRFLYERPEWKTSGVSISL